MRARQALAVVLAVLAGVAAVTGAAAWQLRATFADGERFGDRALDVLDDPAVRQAVADQVAAEAIEDGAPEAQARAASGETVDTLTFRTDFSAAAERLHAGLAGGGGGTLVVDIDPGLQEADPQLAALLGPLGEVDIVRMTGGDLPVAGERLVDLLRTGPTVLLVLACFLLAGALAVAPSRARAVLAAALAVAVTGAGLLLAMVAGRNAAVDAADATGAIDEATARAAAEGVWDALAGGVFVTGIVALAAGALVSVVAYAARR